MDKIIELNWLSVFTWLWIFEEVFEEVFKNSNIKINFIWYSEINKFVKMIYRKHFPNNKDLWSILDINVDSLENIDFLVWWPPCQPYSTAWKRKWAEDPRWEPLVMKYIEILQKKKPEFFIFENVKWLTDKKFWDYFEKILNLMSGIWYTLEVKVLNASDYWTPQRRKRVFIVWYLNKEDLWILDISPVKLKHKFKNLLLPLNQIDDKYIYSKSPMDFMLRETKFKEVIKTRLEMWMCFDTDSDISPTLTANLCRGYPTNFLLDRRKRNDNYCHFWFNTCQFIWQEDVCKECIENDACNYQEIYPKNFHFPVVRKILPIECERLMWFSDNYTKFGIDDKWKEINISDSQRWKAIWNAIEYRTIKKIISNIKVKMLINWF